MRISAKIIRCILLGLLILVVGVPATLYLILSSDWAQVRLRQFGQQELSGLLGTEVSIGAVSFAPFNRLNLDNVTVLDDNGATALEITRLEARVEVIDFITAGKLIVDYVYIDSPSVYIYRTDKASPLNIAGIIDHLKGDGTQKHNGSLSLRLNSLAINDGAFTFDILSDSSVAGRFNTSHIGISDLSAEIFAPYLSSRGCDLRIHHLSFAERSGFSLENLSGAIKLAGDSLNITGLDIRLPNSALLFSDISSRIDSLSHLSAIGRDIPLDFGIRPESYIYPPDLQAFSPTLSEIRRRILLGMQLHGTTDSISLENLTIRDTNGDLNITASGSVAGLTDPSTANISDLGFKVNINTQYLCQLLSRITPVLPGSASRTIAAVGSVMVSGTINGSSDTGEADLTISGNNVNASVFGTYNRIHNHVYAFTSSASLSDADLGRLTGSSDLGHISADFDCSGTLKSGRLSGNANAEIYNLGYKGYEYSGISVSADIDAASGTISVESVDPNLPLSAHASAYVSGGIHDISADIHLSGADLCKLNLYKTYPGHKLSLVADISGSGSSLADFHGSAVVSNLRYTDASDNGLAINHIGITADNTGSFDEITITSDILNGGLRGSYNIPSMVPAIKEIAAASLRQFQGLQDQAGLSIDSGITTDNNFVYDFTIDHADPLSQFFRLPVRLIYPVNISGEVCHTGNYASLTLDAPWLMQGDKIIDDTYFAALIDGSAHRVLISATTHMPTKKGPMNIISSINGTGGQLLTNIDWQIERAIPINGNINFTTSFYRTPQEQLTTHININPGQINFGDDVWQIRPSEITFRDKLLQVHGFELLAENQKINIDGTASPFPEDTLTVALDSIKLIDIFENLEIDKALIGGRATGLVTASSLFSKTPDIRSTNLHVNDIAYNYCTLGDADITAFFNTSKQAFTLDADVTGPGGHHSRIFGDIVPADEALDISFDANRVKVGFMKPFMEAFASDVRGYASGHARLFGTFKYIDLEGDIYADSLQLKLDFTNTWYSASDSLHLRPGLIDLRDITIRDANGNTAQLNGEVRHKYFKAPTFNFAVTNARNFLAYDVTPRLSPDWYGRIYGNGSAHVTGRPGVVDINVNMATAPNSIFTFVLSDTEIADEYSFITFRDLTPAEISDSIIATADPTPEVVKEYQRRIAQHADDAPTDYNMDIQVDITPQAQMVIVMDPVGGDRIKAYGSGNMRMTYNSISNDIRMYGTYTLDRGNYNFTLQDIIIKDFTIKEGSSIKFNGDPYAAVLDIDAYYSVNANLSDLDESFLQDKDLNRTNVPVHALMQVSGDMRQPDIDFDLEFPTLTTSTYRKVKSIVSTEEMMNRQIIYLLALNRFYTPDYMESTTKGNELFSVASSTISSQLSSMLGKLSENWSIAPNLRSDRGDFSDVEVDLALSSTLLNNRLLFNGSFGYRDKSLNTNQFIGDFDIEYLLNRRGSWRLKAYNRYNDQNYYLRTAQTTQGVGIMYRKDFDNLFNFLRPRKKKQTEPADSLPAALGN